MQYETQCLGAANNVLNLYNLLLYMGRKIEHRNYHIFLTSLISRKRYVLPSTIGQVTWSCNVTDIEHEREKCESSVFRNKRLVFTRSITLPRQSYFAWHRLGGDYTDGMYEVPYVIGW